MQRFSNDPDLVVEVSKERPSVKKTAAPNHLYRVLLLDDEQEGHR